MMFFWAINSDKLQPLIKPLCLKVLLNETTTKHFQMLDYNKKNIVTGIKIGSPILAGAYLVLTTLFAW